MSPQILNNNVLPNLCGSKRKLTTIFIRPEDTMYQLVSRPNEFNTEFYSILGV